MNKKCSLAILGTDVFGALLAEELLLTYGDNLAVIGSAPAEKELENLNHLNDINPAYFRGAGKNFTDKFIDSHKKICTGTGFYGGKPVNIHMTAEGLYLLVEKNGKYTTIGTSNIVVTAPAGPDLVNNGFLLPGVDSAVTGLFCRDLDLHFAAGLNMEKVESKNSDRLWRGNWGFKTENDVSTAHGRIYAAGEAARGRPNFENLDKITQKLSRLTSAPAPKPTTDPFSPPYTDVELPPNFYSAKTDKLKSLTSRLFEQNDPDRQLVTRFRQFTGEVAAYARFRTHPDLQRLLCNCLAARRILGVSPGQI